jgi:ABC-type dipeptide/oligopeptide/nickel transport system permease subunit
MAKIIILPLFFLAIFCCIFWGDSNEAWDVFSLRHPLGTDEFGRDMFSAVSASILASAIKGAMLSLLAMAIGVISGYCIVFTDSKIISWLVNLSALVLESIPLMLWMMVMILILPMSNVVLALAFSIGTLPFVSRIVAGEIVRLKQEPFVEASRICGASNLQCTIKHILPNALPVLAPLAVQLSGAGAAADGLFGLIGLGSRKHFDIGTLLFRGKENVLLHPELIIIAIAAITILFIYFGMLFIKVKGNYAATRLYL